MRFSLETVKANFLDRDRFKRAVDAGSRRVLSKTGAFVRQRAKTSIRKRKRPSPPGSPPSSHTGLLRKFIFFAYDPTTRSVVVGPAALRARPTAPEALEKGGMSPVRRKSGPKSVYIRQRPYMVPALEKEMPGHVQRLKGMVR